jgi:hypothetical protein
MLELERMTAANGSIAMSERLPARDQAMDHTRPGHYTSLELF